jgi:hypothetical protein
MQYVWLGVISDHPWLVAIVCGCGAVLSGWRFLLSVRSVRWAFGHRCVRCGHPPAGERCSECGAAEGLPRRHVRKSVCHSVLWCAGLVMLCWSTVILLKLKMWEFVSPETAVRVAFAGGARNDEWIKKIRSYIQSRQLSEEQVELIFKVLLLAPDKGFDGYARDQMDVLNDIWFFYGGTSGLSAQGLLRRAVVIENPSLTGNIYAILAGKSVPASVASKWIKLALADNRSLVRMFAFKSTYERSSILMYMNAAGELDKERADIMFENTMTYKMNFDEEERTAMWAIVKGGLPAKDLVQYAEKWSGGLAINKRGYAQITAGMFELAREAGALPQAEELYSRFHALWSEELSVPLRRSLEKR